MLCPVDVLLAQKERPAMTIADTARFVRADGPDKVTGTGRYVADLTLTGMLHAKFKYAGISHARIVAIDTDAARSMAGVVSVLTAADVPDTRYSPGVADRYLFAHDVVRFDGDIVAAVAATSPEIAMAAVEAIVVTYEPLPLVTDLEAALDESSQLVHRDWKTYEAGETVQGHNLASFSSLERGDAAAALADADIVISSRYVADGSHAVPIEPRGVVAQWEGDKVTIWSSTQVPFDARAGVCETLGLPTNRVRVIVPHLGGGFGGKCGFHFEAHVAALARAARRPVRLLFSREEEFRAPDRRREGMIIDITTGLRADGTIVARTGNLLIDSGAYIADGAFFPQLAAMHVAGPKIPAIKINSSLVYTNHQPSGSVRAPTAPQSCWASNHIPMSWPELLVSTRWPSESSTASTPVTWGRPARRTTRSACNAASTKRRQWRDTAKSCQQTKRLASPSAGGRASACRPVPMSRSMPTARARSLPAPKNVAQVLS
ncbi:MAG: molybdopterin cofactor-binding domain-containing protein [Acidimicrobiales bacterium]